MSSADEETNSDVEYESTESEHLDGSDDEENSENERGLSPETYIATSLKTRETQCNTKNFRWKKRNPMPVQSLFTGSKFSGPPVEEKSPHEYFDMIFDKSLYEKTAEQSNLYFVQTTGKSVQINKKQSNLLFRWEL